CGVPYHSAASYIRKLIESGLKVAICEQIEDPKSAQGIVKREVTRVITPGLLVETENLSATEATYLASLAWAGEEVHVAMIDISTGEVLCGVYDGEDLALQELGKHRVKELLLAPSEVQRPLVLKAKAALPHLLLSHQLENSADSETESEV